MNNNNPNIVFSALRPAARIVLVLMIAVGSAHASTTDSGILKLYGWSTDERSTLAPFKDTQRRASKNLWRTLASDPPANNPHSGIVLSAINAPGVNTTYIELDMGGQKAWIASRITKVERGDEVSFSPSDAVTMENFESRVLKRSFDRIFFVPSIAITSAANR